YPAGVYRDLLLRRWRSLLGRTMWEFPGGREGDDRFLLVGLGEGEPADLTVPANRDDLVADGPLRSHDATASLGTAAIRRAPGPAAARALLTADRYASIEVHPWHPGGRPS
ncbi:hypothetical protein VM98_35760, partial [Streptomyces rubellomurinus subsp. indigoferus]